MKLFFTTLLILTAMSGNAQNMLSNGFGFMAAINGTTYQKTANIGSINYQFVSASKDGQKFYAVNFNQSKIYILNTGNYAFIDSFTGPTPYYITSQNEQTMLFARGDQSLLRYNPVSKTLTDSLYMKNLWGLTERPNSKEIWVTRDSFVIAVNYASSLAKVDSIKTSNNQYDNTDVNFTPKGSIAYKTASSKKKLYKINADTKAIIDSMDTSPYSFPSVVVSADSSKLYAYSTNKIYVIDAATKAFTDSSMTSNKLIMRLYVHPTRDEVWAVHHFNDSVTVFNAATKTTLASFGIGPSPFYLAFATGTSGIKSSYQPNYTMTLYPNPTKDELNISFENAVNRNITISDYTGKTLHQLQSNAVHEKISTLPYAPGAYIINIYEGAQLIKSDSFIVE